MQFLKEFKFKNGFKLSLSFENGSLFYILTNGKHEYRFFSCDTLKTVGYYNMLGSDMKTEEDENSLTIHACPSDENNTPIGPVKVHYNFEVCGDNALRVSTYFTSKIQLPIHMMSWMDLKFERSKFEACQGFSPDFSVGVNDITHQVTLSNGALCDKDGYVMLSNAGCTSFAPKSVNAVVPYLSGEGEVEFCSLKSNVGTKIDFFLNMISKAYALSSVISFGEGKPKLPTLNCAELVPNSKISGKKYEITSGRLSCAVYVREDGASLAKTSLIDFKPTDEPSINPMTTLKIKNLKTGEVESFSSECGWDNVNVWSGKNELKVVFGFPHSLPIRVIITARAYTDDEITFGLQVINDSPDYTVLSASVPSISFVGYEKPNLFIPNASGQIFDNAYEKEIHWNSHYPNGFGCVSPVLGIYEPKKEKSNGLYVAVHSPTAERCDMRCDMFRRGEGSFSFEYPSTSMGKAYNSFEPQGKVSVRVLDGDWYDMACIYEEYVKNHAEWYAPIGRYDTPSWFKDLPVWLMDWMPNDDNPLAEPVPISLRSLVPPKPDDWKNKPIDFAKRLGLPVGYHIYNWHKIPFNNDYPYYFPVKDGFKESIDEFHENNVYVMPYINARLVDTRTSDLSTEKFEREFSEGAVRDVNGKLCIETYASHEPDGSLCQLAAMCPSSHIWREALAEIIRKMSKECHVDGVYLDQVSASDANLCCAPHHNHEGGGGSWWVRSYKNIMSRLKEECKDNCVFTSECNAEPYADQFDGFLTWAWVATNYVPFFSKIYAGHVVMFGRSTNGYKKSDKEYFRFHVGQSVMFGQQIGWINADIIDDEEKMVYLSRMCQMRYEFKDYFNYGKMLRPPKTNDFIPTFVTDSAIGFSDVSEAPLILSSSWEKDGNTVMLITNCDKKEYTLAYDAPFDSYDEIKYYGQGKVSPVVGSKITITISPESAIAIIKKAKEEKNGN